MLYQLAGTFTLLTSLISGWHVTSHLRNFHNPVVQRKVLAILWMAPIYSTTSWFSLVFPHAEAYLSIVRDCYESYVVYVFLSFLISVMGNGDRSLVVAKLAENKLTLQPPCTFCGLCLKVGKEGGAVETAGAVLTQCQGLALQFVLCKPVIAVANFAVNHMGIWKPTQTHEKMEGTLVDWYNPSVYILVCANLSVSCAFFGLLKFYHLVANDLRWCRPWPKFLCIKGVVFATFWQGLAVNILAKTARGEGDGNEGGWAKQAQVRKREERGEGGGRKVRETNTYTTEKEVGNTSKKVNERETREIYIYDTNISSHPPPPPHTHTSNQTRVS